MDANVPPETTDADEQLPENRTSPAGLYSHPFFQQANNLKDTAKFLRCDYRSLKEASKRGELVITRISAKSLRIFPHNLIRWLKWLDCPVSDILDPLPSKSDVPTIIKPAVFIPAVATIREILSPAVIAEAVVLLAKAKRPGVKPAKAKRRRIRDT